MRLTVTLMSFWLMGCATGTAMMNDEHLWLEDIQGEKPLAWAKQISNETSQQLKALPQFKHNEEEIRAILLANDRLLVVNQIGEHLYNYWRDERHVRGIWRRVLAKDFKAHQTKWETVLDLDALAAEEKENWVWKGGSCLAPAHRLCIIRLSRGGQDASVEREYDLSTRTFVSQGFTLPEAKGEMTWVDENHVLVATNFGEGTLTDSGYPRQVKLWTRGTPLSQAKLLFEGRKEDMSVYGYTIHGGDNRRQSFVSHNLSFYANETYWLNGTVLEKIPKPNDAVVVGWFNGQTLMLLRSEWSDFKAGSVLSMSPGQHATLVFAPSDKQTVHDVAVTRNAVVLGVNDAIRGRAIKALWTNGKWHLEPLRLPSDGDLQLTSSAPTSSTVIAIYSSLIKSPTLLALNVDKNLKPRELQATPARFKAKDVVFEQLWTKSKDGTEVPYFVVRQKSQGPAPTLISGYGGFEIPLTPGYRALVGKAWIEKGGTYVVANIRGGGEFGPRWHQAALKQNRQRAFDDFIAIAEDLVRRGYSEPRKLGIMGGSNGGLLVGATFVQRPDLFGAVVCQVPLLDMIRYNKLLAGASWMAEYGNPDIPEEREYLMRYSPYQNVKAGVKYPSILFTTSTLDDRVHPGHARKMVARMRAQNHPVLYFENTEGGHAGAANINQDVELHALEYTFLQSRLF